MLPTEMPIINSGRARLKNKSIKKGIHGLTPECPY